MSQKKIQRCDTAVLLVDIKSLKNNWAQLSCTAPCTEILSASATASWSLKWPRSFLLVPLQLSNLWFPLRGQKLCYEATYEHIQKEDELQYLTDDAQSLLGPGDAQIYLVGIAHKAQMFGQPSSVWFTLNHFTWQRTHCCYDDVTPFTSYKTKHCISHDKTSLHNRVKVCPWFLLTCAETPDWVTVTNTGQIKCLYQKIWCHLD